MQHTKSSVSCTNFLKTLEYGCREMQDVNILIKQKRTKRGVANIVSNIAGGCFGALDSNYAEEISSSAILFKANENSLKQLLRHQTSIIDVTLDVLKKVKKGLKQNLLT